MVRKKSNFGQGKPGKVREFQKDNVVAGNSVRALYNNRVKFLYKKILLLTCKIISGLPTFTCT